MRARLRVFQQSGGRREGWYTSPTASIDRDSLGVGVAPLEHVKTELQTIAGNGGRS